MVDKAKKNDQWTNRATQVTKATAVAIDDYFNKRNNNVIMVVVVVQWSSYLPSAPSSNLLKFNSLSVKMLFGKDKKDAVFGPIEHIT